MIENSDSREKTPKYEERKELLTQTFSQRMKEARKRNSNMIQEVLAEAIGSNTSHISNYEKGKNLPNLINAVVLAEKLNVSLDWLCELEIQNEQNITEKDKDKEDRDFWHTVSVAQALLIVLNRFNPTINITDDDYPNITLCFDKGLITRDNDRLKKYLNLYKQIQELERDGGEFAEAIDVIAEHLVNNFNTL